MPSIYTSGPLRPASNSAIRLVKSCIYAQPRQSALILFVAMASCCSYNPHGNSAFACRVTCNLASNAAVRPTICLICSSAITIGVPLVLGILTTALPHCSQSPRSQTKLLNHYNTCCRFCICFAIVSTLTACVQHVLICTTHTPRW